jgi:methylthioribose-1-phosphate isomerase
MKIEGRPYRTIWLADDGWSVEIIDQTLLPHVFSTFTLRSVAEATRAIRTMQVRGAPLIGVTAAYGLALGLRQDPSDAGLSAAYDMLLAARPTAVNLAWALAEVRRAVAPLTADARAAAAYVKAGEICEDDVAICAAIGGHGKALIEGAFETAERGRPVNVLTHCNAGWLAAVDWGTALAPIYAAHDAGIPVHVWVDETRPRNQGASLTAWELSQHGVDHTIIVDNAGGHLMRCGQVDLCIVGTDRTAANGDVCNKIGTYLKALAAHDNGVPFYVALPGPTVDFSLPSGDAIHIEERGSDEVTHIQGTDAAGTLITVRLAPQASPAANPAFDVTPARLVSGLITERGVAPATRDGLVTLYPERVQ